MHGWRLIGLLIRAFLYSLHDRLYLLTCHGPQAEKMTGELEAVPTDKASRIKARKESMTAGDPNSEKKGTREGPGRSFGTSSIEAHTRMHAHSVMP